MESKSFTRPGGYEGRKGAMFKLLVIYWDNSREEHEYNTREEAEKAAAGYRMAFGNQIQWIGIDKKVV